MHGIPEAQAGMTAKHDTRLPVLGVHYLILAIETDNVPVSFTQKFLQRKTYAVNDESNPLSLHFTFKNLSH
jgi:hypothetical protein